MAWLYRRKFIILATCLAAPTSGISFIVFWIWVYFRDRALFDFIYFDAIIRSYKQDGEFVVIENVPKSSMARVFSRKGGTLMMGGLFSELVIGKMFPYPGESLALLVSMSYEDSYPSKVTIKAEATKI